MLGALLAFAVLAGQPSQMPPFGIIDFYGVPPGLESRTSEALQLHVGDPVPDSLEAVQAVQRRIEGLPGVAQARLAPVCCDAMGRTILFVGVEPAGRPGLRFNPKPRGSVRLPNDVVSAGAAFEDAAAAAVLRGAADDDFSQGHSLLKDPAARAIQERFVGFAARDLPRLRAVLRESADPSERALAAQVIAYAQDKMSIVADLVAAARDPSPEVRNAAVRALGLLAGYAQQNPSRGIVVPPEPFVDLLNSIEWTDRNKSSNALMMLTQARDPALLEALRRRALPALRDMAQWKAPHAIAAFFILGRIAGLSERAISTAWDRGDRSAIIHAAAATR